MANIRNPYITRHVYEYEDAEGANGVSFLETEEGLHVGVETEEGDGFCIPPEHVPALHRYLSAIVLPAVIPQDRVFHDEQRFACAANTKVGATTRDDRVWVRSHSYSAREARALAACLLAAADEAEGVAR